MLKILKKQNKKLKFGLIYSFIKKSNLEIDNLNYLKKVRSEKKTFY